jgi:hypothetical protein
MKNDFTWNNFAKVNGKKGNLGKFDSGKKKKT